MPGSTKSTWAEEEARRLRAALSGLDRWRERLHGGFLGDPASEAQVRRAQLDDVEITLRSGITVIADDLGLDPDYTGPLVALAGRLGARVVFEDRFLKVPVEQCIGRDLGRANPLGAAVIRRLADRYRITV